MKNFTLLKKLYKLEIFAVMGEYCEHGKLLSSLIFEIKSEICREEAIKLKRLKPYDLALKVLKCAKSCNRECLRYAQMTNDGRQFVCDSFHLLIFNYLLPLPALSSEVAGVNIDHVLNCMNDKSFSELELPDLACLRSYIKIKKAEGENHPIYDFGTDYCVVDAQWLADFIDVTGAEKCLFSGPLRALKFLGNDIEAYLLPIKPGKNLFRERTELPEVLE